jgi:hypothetical protein
MPWSRKFPSPIVLKDGRTIATLADASIIVLALPERTRLRPHWQYAGKLLLDAAEQESDPVDAWDAARFDSIDLMTLYS